MANLKSPAKLPLLIERYPNDVYQPSDDTFLFLDALQDELVYIQTIIKPTICIEIGCGNGSVFTYLATHLNQSCFYFGTDINYYAAESSLLTANANGVKFCDTIQMNLLSNFEHRLHQQVDVLLFNPPYVVTDSEEVDNGYLKDSDNRIEASWAGGKNGREIVDRLLPVVSNFLSPRGVFYLVTIEENQPKQIAKIMRSFGFQMESVRQRKAWNERLTIQKFTRC